MNPTTAAAQATTLQDLQLLMPVVNIYVPSRNFVQKQLHFGSHNYNQNFFASKSQLPILGIDFLSPFFSFFSIDCEKGTYPVRIYTPRFGLVFAKNWGYKFGHWSFFLHPAPANFSRARNYRPSFRENKPKTLVFND
jgi:hypothetical protein